MSQTFRDSAIGQWLRLLPGQHVVRYPEEHPNFKLPTEYFPRETASVDQSCTQESRTPSSLEKGEPESEVPSRILTPVVSHNPEEAAMVVTWYSEDDPDNPHNWSSSKKFLIGLLILTYTVSVYIGSSMYTASIPDITSIFGVSETAAALGLSLYVVGYGVGPLLFAPLSEIPAIGRNPPYIYSYIIFVALALATALVDNFAGLLVLRFLLGFFGAPALANAGASYGDFFGQREMPYVIALWGGGATLSPVCQAVHFEFQIQHQLMVIAGSWSSRRGFRCPSQGLEMEFLGAPLVCRSDVTRRPHVSARNIARYHFTPTSTAPTKTDWTHRPQVRV
jgi:DHA1 family multidrug resistance protein-like MFS transporter